MNRQRIKTYVNECIERLLVEGQMQSFKYFEQLKSIVNAILYNSNNGQNMEYRAQYSIKGTDVTIFACSSEIYEKQFPYQKYADGFTDGRAIVLRICKGITSDRLLEVIMHEFEHFLDNTTQGNNSNSSDAQNGFQNYAYDNLYKGLPIMSIENEITEIIYKLWINTESNAYASIVTQSQEKFDNFFFSYYLCQGNHEIFSFVEELTFLLLLFFLKDTIF